MQFRILGPMEIAHDGKQVTLGGSKQRATLGFLLLQANRVVAASRLLNALWHGGEAPRTARKIFQNAVYGLRGALASDPDDAPMRASLLTRPPGYMLRVVPDRIDLHLFHQRVAQGREKRAHGSPEAAAELLRDALALWRGPVLADLQEIGFAWPELEALQNARLDVMEDYFDVQLDTGRHHEVLAELEAMVQAEPLRERSCGQLMLALYRCGRQADALGVYGRVRSQLVANLGLEPGRALRRLQHAVLTQDPVLGEDRGRAALFAERPGERPRDTAEVTTPVVERDAPEEPRTVPAAERHRNRAERRRVSVLSVRTALAPVPGGAAHDSLDDPQDGATGLVREQVERFGGMVTASTGSVSLALFGLDAPSEDDAHRAVQAALAIRDALGAPGLGSAAALTPVRPRAHICVNSGEVLLRKPTAGGGPTVIGALLEESASMLSEVPAGEVWVGHAVRRATEDTVDYCPSNGAGEVIGLRQGPAVGGRGTVRDLTYELDLLYGLARRTRSRSVPHLVTVLGEAGTGKSRLLREFALRSVEAPTDHSVSAQGRAQSRNCGIRPGESVTAARGAVSWKVDAPFGTRPSARRTLFRLLPLADAATPGVGSWGPLETWHGLVRRATLGEPLVLCIDDLHRADDAALEGVESLTESSGRAPLFVVATARPELLLRRPTWTGGKGNVTTVTMGCRSGTSRGGGRETPAAGGARPTVGAAEQPVTQG